MEKFKNPRSKSLNDPLPTFGINYQYFTNPSDENNIVNVKEIGGGRLLANLIDVPLNEKNFLNTIYVVVIDLSHPKQVYDSLKYWLTNLKKRVYSHIQY